MGGSAREWSTVLPADTVGGGAMSLELVMTKFGGEPVEIAWEVRVE